MANICRELWIPAGKARRPAIDVKFIWVAALACALSRAADVRIGKDGVLQFNGKPSFPIGFTTFPVVDAKAPSGGDAYAELGKAGTVFNRCGTVGKWNAAAEAKLDAMLAQAARSGVFCAIYIPELAVIARANRPRRPNSVASSMSIVRCPQLRSGKERMSRSGAKCHQNICEASTKSCMSSIRSTRCG